MKLYGEVTNIAVDGWPAEGDRPAKGALIYVQLAPGEKPPPEGTSINITKFDRDVRFDATGGLWARRTALGPLIHFAPDGKT